MAIITSYPHAVPTTNDLILISKSSNKTTRSTTVSDVIDLIETGLLPGVGTVTSIGVTAPSAFTVTNSPVTSTGTIAITGSGTTSQYIDGTGSLQDSHLFKNVEVFKLLSLPNGLTFSTESYYSSLDGGSAEYRVVLSSEYVGTVDGYGDHTLSNGNIAVLQSKIASAKQFGAKDGVESGIHIQSMFNWCAKSTNTSYCVLGHSEERFKISKSLVLSSRHSGLNFSCKNAWIDIIQGTVATTALKFMMGEYDVNFTYFIGDALGTTVKDINIDVLNIMSDAPVEEKAILYLDAVSLLPANGGDSAAYTVAHSNFQNYFLNNGYATGGAHAIYSPSLNFNTIDLSVDFFENININTCNFVNVGRSGINLSAKSDDFNIGTITQNGCIYHPLSTTVPAFFATNVDFIINLNVGYINVENTSTIFDFSAETKHQTVPHGYINIERAIGRKIRGRTKIHGNYHEISIGLLDSEQQTGGELIGNWAVLSFLEGIKLYIDKIISRSANYTNANGVLYVGNVNNAYGNRNVLINNSISYLPEINSNGAQSIFYDQNTNIISFTNKYTIKNIEVFGVLPTVLNSLKGYVTIGNINIYSSSVSNRVLSNALINSASLFLSISKLYVDFLTFNTVTSPLINVVNDSNAPLKVLNIGHVVIGDATGVDSGILVTALVQMPDISISSIITPAALSLRCLVRSFTADGSRCGILMVANSITDAGLKYPVENPEYLVFAKNQFITGQPKPALVWFDSQNSVLKYNLDRPTSEVDGTNV